VATGLFLALAEPLRGLPLYDRAPLANGGEATAFVFLPAGKNESRDR